jgi:hypothetical protein
MSSRTLFRWAAAALIVSAVSVTLGRILHPAVDAAGITSPQWGVSHILWLIGLLTGMVGLVGLYLRQRKDVGVLGFIGAGAAWVGMALLSGTIYFEGIIEPAVLAQAPALAETLVSGEGWGVFFAVFLVSVALFGVGFLLLGIAMYRAAVLPRWAVVLVVVGSVVGGPQSLLPRPIATLAFLTLGVGLAGLGCGLWASAEAPSAHPAVGGRPSVAES